ncbi:protein of unknown function DUF292 [Macleaya cordata]|uniref:Vacuolar protein sorting-associated protein Ist1 n=1 Tax=Macleaya cordata TaxID=56857 RepID=A0A200QMV2_MACCD|nr:protein of unknown function DUF292 [Macleaya cordata]
MLHRSFKGGKCKTSLRLAVARIKLLKNKREVQLRQMKRDLAQLLEAGQEQTARIRVEHVVREEKTMAAYDLIELYCELIVARLPIIESQKNCPIDLKEAITSVVFASPRCADVPELLDVRKHFTAKYGKEFIASALELRPECGVNRNIVEKLSARAPDGETKIKILTTIAKEHNVKWEHKDFEEKELKPPEDLLNGPSTFGNTGKMAVESPSVQPQPTPGQKYDSSINISGKRSSMSSQDYASINTTSSMARPTTSHPQSIAPESRSEGREFRDASSEEGNAFSMNRQKWNMEFKDATEAAQAAAESAERASMAARAAAELSSGGKNMRQHAPEFHESFDYSVRDEGPGTSAGPKLKGERVKQEPVKMTYDSRTSSSRSMDRRMQNQHRDKNETDNLGGAPGYHGYDSGNRRSGQSFSPGFTMASIDDEMSVANLQKEADHYNQKSSFEVESTNPNWESRKIEKGHFRDEVSIQNQSSDSEAESVDQRYKSKKTDYTGFALEGEIRKHSSKSASFSSRLNTDGDDANLNSDIHNYGNDIDDHFFNNTDKGNMQRDTKQPSSNDYHGVVFDEYGSDEDRNLGVEGVYNSHEPNSYAPSPVRKLSSPPSPTIDSWTPRKQRSGSMEENYGAHSVSNMEPLSPSGFLGGLSKATLPSKSDSLLHATFDDSDGLNSESEEEMDNYKHTGRTETTNLPHKQNVFTRTSESTENDCGHGSTRPSSFLREETAEAYEKPWSGSSFDYTESEDGHTRRNQETKLNFGGESAKTYSGHGSTKSSFIEKEAAGTDRKPRLPSSSDDSESEGFSENQEKQLDFGGESRKQYGHGALPSVKAFPGHISSPRNLDRESGIEEKKLPLQTTRISSAKEDQAQNNFSASLSPDAMEGLEYPSNSSSESGHGLNLGRLRGGIRNKGHTLRTYTKDPSIDASPQSIQQSAENTPTFNEQPNVSPKFKSSTSSKVHKEFSSRSPKTYFDSDSDDSEPLPRQTGRNKGYTSGKLTYKMRDSPKESGTSNLSTFMGGSDVQVTSQVGTRKKASTLSHGSGPISVPQMQNLSLESRDDFQWPEVDTSVEQQTYNSASQPEVSVRKGNLRSRSQETNSSVENRPSKPIPQPETVGSTETPAEDVSARSTKTSKPSISTEGSASRENSLKKAGHVHPKLPDYDTFAAHFESLRSNRRSS